MTKRFFWFLLAVVTFMVCAGLWGCSPRTVFVPVERTVHDSVRSVSWLTEYIHDRDSVIIRATGDTVFVDRWQWRWRDREVHDTVYASHVDSIPKPYPVEKRVKVERDFTAWETVRLWSWWGLLAALVTLAGWNVLRWKRGK